MPFFTGNNIFIYIFYQILPARCMQHIIAGFQVSKNIFLFVIRAFSSTLCPAPF